MLAGRVVSDDSQAALTFHPIPGGAPANVAVAVARLGGASYFAGAVARAGAFMSLPTLEDLDRQ